MQTRGLMALRFAYTYRDIVLGIRTSCYLYVIDTLLRPDATVRRIP